MLGFLDCVSHSSIQAIRQFLSDYQLADHADVLAGDADEVGALCQAVDIETLGAVAEAFEGLGSGHAAMQVNHGNLHLAADTVDGDGDIWRVAPIRSRPFGGVAPIRSRPFGGLLPFGRDRQMGLGWIMQTGSAIESMPTEAVVKLVLTKVLYCPSPQTVRTLAM